MTEVSGFRFLRPSRTRLGITLIELIVVIVILSLLMGLSIVLFKNANRDLGVRASANHTVSILRAVHQHTRAESSPGWVLLNLQEPSIFAITKETVGMWHFERLTGGMTPGAFGKDAHASSVSHVPGRAGRALSFKGNGTVACGEVPIYDAKQGVALEFWLYRTNARARQSIASIGPIVEIFLESNGVLKAKAGPIEVSTKGASLPPEIWFYVQYFHNGREATLLVDGQERESKPGVLAWTGDRSLTLGAKTDALSGILDEVRLGLLVSREKYLFPGEAKIVWPEGARPDSRGECVIHFDSEGRLNAAHHGQPVRFTIKSPAEEKRVTVLLNGLVQR